jgi:dCMP deaminase
VSSKWDQDFLALARWFAQRKSKDPSTQTGAVITRDRQLVSMGYNGFARGVKDLPERYANRELKYRLIVHCERNAMLLAKQDLSGCTLYTWPFMSCSACAGMVIQAGITRCVAPSCPPDKLARWAEDMELAQMQFREAGVVLDFVELTD